MGQLDLNAYATTSANAAAGASNLVETQQPGGTGSARQVMILGDATTRGNIQKVTTAGQALVATPDVATTGTMAALNAAVTTAVNSQGIVAIQLTGTWVGTVTFQGTEDPAGTAATTTSWFNVNGVASVSGVQVTSSTANGQFRVNAGGYTAVRAIMTAFTSGSATAWLNASLAPSMATLAEPLPAGTNLIGTIQGYQPASATFSAVTTVSTLTSMAALGLNVATLTLRTFTGTTPSITFGLQASDDNTNWVTIQGIHNTTGIVSTTWTQAAALTAGTGGPSIDYAVGGYTNVRIAVTAISGTTPSAAFGLGLQSMPYEPSPGIASLPSLPIGTNNIGTVNIASRTTGGATTFTLISAATTNGTNVKASAGTLYSLSLSNNGAAAAYLKLFNLAVAPTVGTSVATQTFLIPAGGGREVTIPAVGWAFGTGIAYSVTALGTTADVTAVAVNQVFVNGSYA